MLAHGIGHFKIVLRWILGIFNVQIQSERGLMRHIKVKDLLVFDLCKWGCGPFCVSLLIDRCFKELR